jgi:tetratricopeptide (TPR) repeat protein
LIDWLARAPEYEVRECNYSRAHAEQELGRFDEAIKDLQIIIDNGPADTRVENLEFQALCYTLSRRASSAIPILKRAIELEPKRADLHDNLARAYKRCGLDRNLVLQERR